MAAVIGQLLAAKASQPKAAPGEILNINVNFVPEDLDELKELVDFMESKKWKTAMKKTAATGAAITGALGVQWLAEESGVSPPIIHYMMDFLRSLANAAEGASDIMGFASGLNPVGFFDATVMGRLLNLRDALPDLPWGGSSEAAPATTPSSAPPVITGSAGPLGTGRAATSGRTGRGGQAGYMPSHGSSWL